MSSTHSPASSPLPSDSDTILISRKITHSGWDENQVTLFSPIPDHLGLEQIDPLSGNPGASVLNADFWGNDKRLVSLAGEMRQRGIPGPETVLLPDTGDAGGMQIGTLSGLESTPVQIAGRLVGRIFEDADAKYCFLGDVQPVNPSATRFDQAGQVFESIEKVLAEAGMHFRDVVRTWFYVDRILDWYDDFNHVRTGFFEKHGITRMPASTGIGCPNSGGTALVAKVVAVLPKTGKVVIKPLHSPLQCEAASYGSSFSRAMEVCDSCSRTIYVSGTASIEPGGQTVHIGDTYGQIEKTMEVVTALLEHARMDLSNTTRAIAYFRHRKDIPLWNEYCHARQLPVLPAILTPSVICREDLLFEIELDAATAV